MYDKTLTGHLVLEHRVLKDGFLALENGKIVAIGQGSPPPAKEHLDFSGCVVMPGAIDTHTHAFSALEEGFVNLTRSAAAGGVTTLFDMPYDDPDPVVTTERLLEKGERLKIEASVAVGLYGTVAKGAGAGQVLELAGAGAVAFKFSTFETHLVRFPRIGNMQLLEVLEAVNRTGKVACFHAEDQELIDGFTTKVRAEGRTDPLAHCESRPEIAELVAISGLLELGKVTGAKVHIVHVTTAAGFALIESAAWHTSRNQFSAETCLHYLMFADEDMLEHGAQLKINPPLRKLRHVERLWEVLRSDSPIFSLEPFVTSDHVAWPLSRKDKLNIFDNASGMPGVETLLPFLLDAYLKRIATPELEEAAFLETANLVSTNAAKRFGLEGKGKIAIGFDADLAVLERGKFTWKAAESHSSAKWSPFDGRAISVRVVHTLLGGVAVWDGKNVLEGQGYWLKT